MSHQKAPLPPNGPPPVPLKKNLTPHELQYKLLREQQQKNSNNNNNNTNSSNLPYEGASSSVRSSSSRPPAGDSTRSGGGGDVASTNGRLRGSVRSNRSAGGGAVGEEAPSASLRSGAGSSSIRSITSSVALGKLAELEHLLLKERRARGEAEATLVALQKERTAREAAVNRALSTQQQLDDVLRALRTVVMHPDDPSNVGTLQRMLKLDGSSGGNGQQQASMDNNHNRGKRNKQTSGEAAAAAVIRGIRSNTHGTSLDPGVSDGQKYVNKATSKFTKNFNHNVPGYNDDVTTGRSVEMAPPPLSNNAAMSTTTTSPPRSFFDNIGHYERARERDRKRQQMQKQQQMQQQHDSNLPRI